MKSKKNLLSKTEIYNNFYSKNLNQKFDLNRNVYKKEKCVISQKIPFSFIDNKSFEQYATEIHNNFYPTNENPVLDWNQLFKEQKKILIAKFMEEADIDSFEPITERFNEKSFRKLIIDLLYEKISLETFVYILQEEIFAYYEEEAEEIFDDIIEFQECERCGYEGEIQ